MCIFFSMTVPIQHSSKNVLPQLCGSCTCWRAASSLSCFRTESLHTASQRPSSSSICSCSQWASAVLLLVRSLTERFSVRMHPARFPNSFWKACKKKERKKTLKEIFLKDIGKLNQFQSLLIFIFLLRFFHNCVLVYATVVPCVCLWDCWPCLCPHQLQHLQLVVALLYTASCSTPAEHQWIFRRTAVLPPTYVVWREKKVPYKMRLFRWLECRNLETSSFHSSAPLHGLPADGVPCVFELSQ